MQLVQTGYAEFYVCITVHQRKEGPELTLLFVIHS